MDASWLECDMGVLVSVDGACRCLPHASARCIMCIAAGRPGRALLLMRHLVHASIHVWPATGVHRAWGTLVSRGSGAISSSISAPL
jgi:hypothetical protein